MSMRKLFAAGAAVGLLSTSAFSAVAWTNASGSTSLLSWSNGQSENGLFGSPTVSGDTFFFLANNNFTAIAANGGVTPTTDTLSVTIDALGMNEFTEVLFYSSGDYNLLGAGSTFDVTGDLTIENNDNGDTFVDPFTVTTSIPGSGDAFGQWEGFSLINLLNEAGGPFTSIDISFTNSIIAISGNNGSSTVSLATLPVTQASFALRVIPTPGTGIALFGGVALLARRRR